MGSERVVDGWLLMTPNQLCGGGRAARRLGQLCSQLRMVLMDEEGIAPIARFVRSQSQWIQILKPFDRSLVLRPRDEVLRTKQSGLPRPRIGGPSAVSGATLRTSMGAASAGDFGSTKSIQQLRPERLNQNNEHSMPQSQPSPTFAHVVQEGRYQQVVGMLPLSPQSVEDIQPVALVRSRHPLKKLGLGRSQVFA